MEADWTTLEVILLFIAVLVSFAVSTGRATRSADEEWIEAINEHVEDRMDRLAVLKHMKDLR